MAFIYSMVDTWNDIGTTFNSIYMNTSNGAGGAAVGSAASRLLRLDDNSTPVFEVDINGATLAESRFLAGNSASFTSVVFAPGDPLNEFSYAMADVQPIYVSNNFYTGDFSGAFITIFPMYDNLRHTGAGSAGYTAVDVEPFISSNSTGNFSYYNGSFYAPTDAGSGNISAMSAFTAQPTFIGASGTKNNISGFTTVLYIDATIGTLTITNYRGAWVSEPQIVVGSPTIVNNYGIYIADQSGYATTLNYNIYSAGDGFNLFQGITGVGNYANSNTATFSPGDPTLADPIPLGDINPNLVVNNYYLGDFTGLSATPMVNWAGLKHTGAGEISGYAGFDVSLNINTDSTGDVDLMIGASYSVQNNGTGHINSLRGFSADAANFGDSTVVEMIGVNIALETDDFLGGTPTVDDAFGITINGFAVGGAAVLTNNYGLFVGDQSAIATTLNYNIYSAGDDTSFNAFRGVVAAGNVVNSTNLIYGPGDPSNETLYPYADIDTTFVSNAYYVGDLSTRDISSFKMYYGYKHTGAGSSILNVFDIEPLVNEDSTGPINSMYGFYVGPANSGQGAVASIQGLYFQPAQFGDGTVTSMTGFYTNPYIDNTLNTAAVGSIYGIQITTPTVVGTPTISSSYGIYIQDQSGIATTLNYNIYSAGDGYNYFDGLVRTGNFNTYGVYTYKPGSASPSNYSIANNNVNLLVNSYINGDLTGVGIFPIVSYIGVKHTGVGTVVVGSMDVETTINPDSTGPVAYTQGIYFANNNYGSGAVGEIDGIYCQPSQYGNGLVGNIYAIISEPYLDDTSGTTAAATNIIGTYVKPTLISGTPAITNNYGLYVGDQSGIGSTLNYNIYSAGDGYSILGGFTTIGFDGTTPTGVITDEAVRLFVYNERDLGGGVGYTAVTFAAKPPSSGGYVGSDITFAYVPFGSSTLTRLYGMGAEVNVENDITTADYFFFDSLNSVIKIYMTNNGNISFGSITSGSTLAGAFLAIMGASGNIKIGNGDTAVRGTTEGTKHIDIFDGTAPVGTLTNGISLFSAGGVPMSMDATGFYSSIIPKTGPTANASAATTITNGADSATNLGHRIQFDYNGTTYWVPCGVTAF